MRLLIRKLAIISCCALALPALSQQKGDVEAGPLYAEFPLTLTSGYRREAAGPFYYYQQSESEWQWALPPFYDFTRTPDVDWAEWEVLYPFIDYRRFGHERRLQILELISFSGGKDEQESDAKRFTIFPFYFQQRAPDTNLNYTAVVPFYGHLKNRLFRDEQFFIMFPVYAKTRKKDVVTDNYLFPFFDVRHGDNLKGWQFWPVTGVEHKGLTLSTNSADEVVTNGGYDKFFALWPIYFKDRTGLGTTNETNSLTVFPFYSKSTSPTRVQTSYGWPLGYNIIHDSEQKYDEHDYVWPLNVVARGSKTITRVFPFYSHAQNADLESDFYLWPLVKYNRLEAGPLERKRTRIMFFLYSDIAETNRDSAETFHRQDFWPFYTYRKENDGRQRLQVLAILEPFFPDNRAMSREYAQVYSFWRAEKNPKTGASSQSLLWNLYRRDETPQTKNCSLLFGLFQYQSGVAGRRWRVCHITVAKRNARPVAPQS